MADLSISVSVVVVDDNQTDEEPCLVLKESLLTKRCPSSCFWGSLGPGSGRHDCEIILEVYDECMGKIGQTASSCDRYLKQKEDCRNFKRNPNLQPISEGLKKWQESEQRRAAAAGFASMDEYHRHEESQDPQMCQTAYEFYKECISKGYSHCDGYCKNSPQFK